MHYHDPNRKAAHVAVFYRDFKDYGGEYGDDDYGSEGGGPITRCHRGLGINALMTVKVLRKQGIRSDLVAVLSLDDVRAELKKHAPTHAVFQALWITAEEQAALCLEFPGTHFIVRCHSQIGFLQVEPKAIGILRDLMALQEGMLNLTVSTNTRRLHEFLQHTYHARVLYLPNLYDLERSARKRDETHHHRLLRVSSFGAHRVMKNHTTAAAAAMMMAKRRSSDLEFYVNAGRAEGSGKDGIITSLRFMFDNVRWAKLIEVPWEEWSAFRQTVAYMDLSIQASFSETFNIVAADSVAEGVPCVVSDAIEWAPDRWKAHVDDAADIARVGSHLLWDQHGADEGLEHLTRYCKEGAEHWLRFLGSNPT